jgi:hypothetical protein
MTKRVSRLDYQHLGVQLETTPLKKTKEGFMVGRACLTGIGVFSYPQPDGSLRRELRTPEEVGKSFAALAMKPITDDHPTEDVSARNAKLLQVGSVGNDVSFDGYNVFSTISITHEESVASIERKEAKALSCGYDCRLEMEAGVWQGVHYDAIQKDIVYNHVALVEEGRAGDAVRLRLDRRDSQQSTQTQEASVALKKTTLDGVEREAEAEVIVALTKEKERADSASTKLKDLETQISKLTAERDSLKDELQKSKKDDAAINKAVQARLDLLDTARKLGVEAKTDESDDAIRMAVIKKASPSANLDGKDPVYIAARFDSAVEILSAASTGAGGAPVTDTPPGGRSDSMDDLRAAMDRQIYDASKGGK